jgi:serine/threonine-protein kinase
MSMKLAITAGPDKGRSFPFTEGEILVIGRGRTATARLKDPCVSRIHCQLRADGDNVILADCNSTAGTFLNKERIEQQLLQPGDVIRIGDTEITFDLEASADMAEAAAKRDVVVDATRAPKHELDDLAGKTIHCYHVMEVLAHGKSGTVFQAISVESGEFVALKVLWPIIARDTEGMRRFVQTMKMMFPLRHPNVVRIYHASRSGPYWWTAMELVEGESLTETIKRIESPKTVDWRSAFRVAVHVGRALEVAHKHQIIHSMITPQNILVSQQDKTAKLGDLMLAKALEGTAARQIARPGIEDVAYMSPERTRTSTDLDCRSDMYSLGAVVYARLTGRPPFEAPSLKELVSKIRDEPLVRPKESQPSMPDIFEDAVVRMLAKSPDDRYQTPSDLLADLGQIGKNQGLEI